MSTRFIVLCAVLLCLGACMRPQLQAHSGVRQVARLYDDHAVMADGYRLPLSMTRPQGEVRGVILALHGFNDYRNAFHDPAGHFAGQGLLTVAYDQRGFGATALRGLWPGEDTLAADAAGMAALLCTRYPGVPLYLLGESMGGAVALQTLRAHAPSCVRGVILVAPAVWGWSAMPWWQSVLLRIAAHLMPGRTVTGEGLDIMPSDNIDMLRALGQDPLVIKATRIDTIYGLTDLMDAAGNGDTRLPVPVLLLYGEHDQIIPSGVICDLLDRTVTQEAGNWRMALYPRGYHMLTRDLHADEVLADVAAWTLDPAAALPSGQAVAAASPRLRTLCGGPRRYRAGKS